MPEGTVSLRPREPLIGTRCGKMEDRIKVMPAKTFDGLVAKAVNNRDKNFTGAKTAGSAGGERRAVANLTRPTDRTVIAEHLDHLLVRQRSATRRRFVFTGSSNQITCVTSLASESPANSPREWD
jgi:hypothetical protein